MTYELRYWIPRDRLNYNSLSLNPNAVGILGKQCFFINWKYFSANPYAIDILEKNINRLNWCYLSKNKNAIHILKQKPSKINWFYISANPNAIEIIEQYLNVYDLMSSKIDKYQMNEIYKNCGINWMYLSGNINAIDIITKPQYYDNIDWHYLSKNKNAIDFLNKPDNIKNINWTTLCMNTNPKVMELLNNNYDKICWKILSTNKNAIDLLLDNMDKINWSYFCLNTNTIAIKILKYIINKQNNKNNNHCSMFDKNELSIKYENDICELFDQHKINCMSININWCHLSSNPSAIDILVKNYDKISWKHLIINEYTIFLLENKLFELGNYTSQQIFLNNLNWNALSMNPIIFNYVKKN